MESYLSNNFSNISTGVFSTPTKGKLNTPRTPKTPTTGDRFIPSRSSLDVNVSMYQMYKQEEEANIDTTPLKENYKATVADSIFNGKFKKARCLNFQAETNYKKDTSPIRLASQMKTHDSPIKSQTREIAPDPERVLDAPNLVEDYYLNLLDWSSQNILAIALANSVYLWNANDSTTKHLLKLQETNPVTSVSYCKDGDYLAVGTSSAEVQIWNIEKSKMVRKMTGHAGRISSLTWNGNILTSGSRDSKILNHDVRLAKPIVSIFEGHNQEVCGLKWSPDGSYLASGGNDNLLMIWDSVGSSSSSEPVVKPLHKLEHHIAAVKALAWCPWQSGLLASGGGTADRTLRFWNVSASSTVCVNSIDTKSQVCAIQWSPQHRELVTSHGYSQNQLIVWKYPSLVKIAELKGHTSRVLHLGMSPDGKTVASAAGDDTLRFWKIFDEVAPKSPKNPIISGRT